MKIAAAYEVWSTSYDANRNLTRDLDEEITRLVLQGRRWQSILELGCGTGKNTCWLSQIGDRVQALDFSPTMIAHARQKAALANVTFTVADITGSWPIAAGSIGLISCNLVLEHISDLRPVFAQAARVLSAGGEFFVSELHPFRQYQGVQARFEHDGGTIAIPAFVHHVSDFLGAAAGANLSLQRLQEWWHPEDNGKPPRLISFLFRKSE
jgi:ubiquinone/menaquinone biosynthesis C-methylase UbiE